jgi:zinc protease
MKRRAVLFAAAFVCALGVHAKPPAFMKGAPEVPPLSEFAVPARARFTLANQMKVVFVRDTRAPLVTARVVFKGASRILGRGAAGLPEAFASLLTAGTAELSAREVVEAADALGGAVEGEAGEDDVVLGGFALKENAGALFRLLDACAFDAAFSEKEVSLRRENMLVELKSSRAQAGYLAGVAFWRGIYGNHPYGISADEDSIAKVTPKRMRGLHDRAAVPSNMTLVVVGDLEREELSKLLAGTLGARTGRGALTVPPYPELNADERAERRILFVDRPGSAQVAIRLGHRAPRETRADYEALQVANMAFGGSFAARLTMDLREKRGYTYGAYSWLDSFRSAGAFYVKLQTRSEVAKKALKRILKHLKGLTRRRITEKELAQAKNLLVAGFVRQFETQAGAADAFAHSEARELPDSYLDGYVSRVQRVTRAQALAAARAHLHPGRLAIAVVGDAGEIERGLRRLSKSPLQRVDENGVPVNP